LIADSAVEAAEKAEEGKIRLLVVIVLLVAIDCILAAIDMTFVSTPIGRREKRYDEKDSTNDDDNDNDDDDDDYQKIDDEYGNYDFPSNKPVVAAAAMPIYHSLIKNASDYYDNVKEYDARVVIKKTKKEKKKKKKKSFNYDNDSTVLSSSSSSSSVSTNSSLSFSVDFDDDDDDDDDDNDDLYSSAVGAADRNENSLLKYRHSDHYRFVDFYKMIKAF